MNVLFGLCFLDYFEKRFQFFRLSLTDLIQKTPRHKNGTFLRQAILQEKYKRNTSL